MSGLVDIVLTEADIPGASLKEPLGLQIWMFSLTVGVSYDAGLRYIVQYLQWVFLHNQRVSILKTTAKTTKFIAMLFLVASLD